MTTTFIQHNGRRPIIGCIAYNKPILPAGADFIGIRPTYIESIINSGGIPILIPTGVLAEDASAVLARVDGLILPGGGDIESHHFNGNHPQHPKVDHIDVKRDALELAITRQILTTEKPLLAICRGHQILNVALGGTLWEDIPDQMPESIRHDYFDTYTTRHLAHSVEIMPDSQLAKQLGCAKIEVNSLHHQGIRDLAADLRVTAVAPDGLIEGVEIADHPFAIGVQWHPETLIHDNPRMLALFQGLVNAAAT